MTDLVLFLDPVRLKWLNKVKLTFWVEKWKPEVEGLEQRCLGCFLFSQTCLRVSELLKPPALIYNYRWSNCQDPSSNGRGRSCYYGDDLGSQYRVLQRASSAGKPGAIRETKLKMGSLSTGATSTQLEPQVFIMMQELARRGLTLTLKAVKCTLENNTYRVNFHFCGKTACKWSPEPKD